MSEPLTLQDFVRRQMDATPGAVPTDGGFLVPFDFQQEIRAIAAGDPRPSRPSWWQFWRKGTYSRAEAAWKERWLR